MAIDPARNLLDGVAVQCRAAAKLPVRCRCDIVDEGMPGAYCGRHDRAATYAGRPVRSEPS